MTIRQQELFDEIYQELFEKIETLLKENEKYKDIDIYGHNFTTQDLIDLAYNKFYEECKELIEDLDTISCYHYYDEFVDENDIESYIQYTFKEISILNELEKQYPNIYSAIDWEQAINNEINNYTIINLNKGTYYLVS